MPELPEVESIRRVLEPELRDLRLARVHIARRDVIRDPGGRRRGPIERSHLGVGSRLRSVDRRGKQLILGFENGSSTVVRLGMSGRMEIPTGRRGSVPPHRHVIWTFEHPDSHSRRLWFIDPRRFGGVHLAVDPGDLSDRLLGNLGPEAPGLRPSEISSALRRTRRCTKTALLDQGVVAGIGNIYADEALHRAGIHPARPACGLDRSEVTRMCRHIRAVMLEAIEAGGSTLRDHRLPDGSPGGYRDQHRVYGREGAPCPSCGVVLEWMRVAERSTTYCPACQT